MLEAGDDVGDLVLQELDSQTHTVPDKVLEEGEIIPNISKEQFKDLFDIPDIEDVDVDSDDGDLKGAQEILLDPIDETLIRTSESDIQKRMNNPETSLKPTSSEEQAQKHKKWMNDFVKSVPNSKPQSSTKQATYMKLEKNRSQGHILGWVYVKDLQCIAVKRELGIQYFSSFLRILSLPHYDASALTRIKVINRSGNKLMDEFEKRLRWNKRIGWKNDFYKPRCPERFQLRFTIDKETNEPDHPDNHVEFNGCIYHRILCWPVCCNRYYSCFPLHLNRTDPTTNTGKYKFKYKAPDILKHIPLPKMSQDFLGNMHLWCYDGDTTEAVIVFKDETPNFRIFDSMWIVNLSKNDIAPLVHHDIVFE
ncbi:hypothetical protein Hanom_Chr12g01086631 [Helianthus anomalus]